MATGPVTTEPPKTGPIRLVLADDEPMLRSTLRLLLEATSDVVVVGEAENGQVALDLVAAHEVDLVLMDVRMPVMDGIEATARITARPGAPKVLVLTTFNLDDYVFRALSAGASGFLLKDTAPKDLLAGIRVVAAGESLLGPSITRKLIAEFTGEWRQRQPLRQLTGVTEREREVLTLITHGLSNVEIQERLFLSRGTVKTHIGRLLAKLGARDRAQLVIAGYEAGLARQPWSAGRAGSQR
ncbi:MULTISPECIES: response regulator transcription factor [unclassified Crossiella]|uniref:response regulator n=1 Tax=unclassified Crossiella TaxID=2620835 RepID=UPI0020001D59|nr:MULTISPECIES: response regulator transcription factor [unclassified Crossiella]MCK2243230.1 response regulator transcription factor [Crossiella sp. S99.2]MCK2254301.1 response regulator transcription factor [Crossiella sp. S99.1]